jgi:hypothetical protein
MGKYNKRLDGMSTLPNQVEGLHFRVTHLPPQFLAPVWSRPCLPLCLPCMQDLHPQISNLGLAGAAALAGLGPAPVAGVSQLAAAAGAPGAVPFFAPGAVPASDRSSKVGTLIPISGVHCVLLMSGCRRVPQHAIQCRQQTGQYGGEEWHCNKGHSVLDSTASPDLCPVQTSQELARTSTTTKLPGALLPNGNAGPSNQVASHPAPNKPPILPPIKTHAPGATAQQPNVPPPLQHHHPVIEKVRERSGHHMCFGWQKVNHGAGVQLMQYACVTLGRMLACAAIVAEQQLLQALGRPPLCL